jgi:hypothetical protein
MPSTKTKTKTKMTKTGKTKKKNTTKITRKNLIPSKLDVLSACEKKYCKKEMQARNILEQKNWKLARKQKCNNDENMNYKYDDFNKVKIVYDFNPFHFPYNRRITSPCIEQKHKLMNDPNIYNASWKCTQKNCKKEYSEFSH